MDKLATATMPLPEQACYGDQFLELILHKPVAFGWEAGFNDLQDLHNQWIKSFLFSQDDQTLQAHRGSYKTTCASVAMALMLAVYPMKNIIFVRKTDADVKEILAQVGKLLQNDFFRALVKSIYDEDLAITKQSAYEIDTSIKVGPKGAPQLLGLGSKASITGKHADIIFTDDIVNLTDRVSRAERERTKLVYQELQNVKNPGGRFINCGTPWHKDDAFSLMPNIQKYDCYSTGLISPEKLSDLRLAMSPALYAANYELKHIADADALFTAPRLSGTKELVIEGIGHIDAAYGGGDYTAFTSLKKTPRGYQVFGKLWPKHVDKCLGEISAYHKELKLGTVYCESNADKGYLAKELRELGIPASLYAEKMNKFIKISSHLRGNWEQITFAEDTDPEYLEQILDYTESAAHDDAPDSLASIIRIAERKGAQEVLGVDDTISAFKALGL